jgi:hypothetical protein
MEGGENETMWVAHRNNGSNDERVVVAQHNIVRALEAYPKLGTSVLLCMLQCTTCEKQATKNMSKAEAERQHNTVR